MEDFIIQLLQDQGVPQDLSPEVRTQLIADLTSRATDFANQRLVEAMNNTAVEQFNGMLDDPSITPAQIQDFVSTNVPNREKVIAAALVEFRTLYLGNRA